MFRYAKDSGETRATFGSLVQRIPSEFFRNHGFQAVDESLGIQKCELPPAEAGGVFGSSSHPRFEFAYTRAEAGRLHKLKSWGFKQTTEFNPW